MGAFYSISCNLEAVNCDRLLHSGPQLHVYQYVTWGLFLTWQHELANKLAIDWSFSFGRSSVLNPDLPFSNWIASLWSVSYFSLDYTLFYRAIKWVGLPYSRIQDQNHDGPDILSNQNYLYFFLSFYHHQFVHCNQLTKSMAASITQKLLIPTISIPHQNNQLFTISLFKQSLASQKVFTKLVLHSSCWAPNTPIQFNMATTTNHFSKNSITLTLLLLTIIISSLHHLPVHSLEFQVGGNRGWVVPPANDSKIYNDWASENRFQVGDTIRESQATHELTYFILLIYFPFSFWDPFYMCVCRLQVQEGLSDGGDRHGIQEVQFHAP